MAFGGAKWAVSWGGRADLQTGNKMALSTGPRKIKKKKHVIDESMSTSSDT